VASEQAPTERDYVDQIIARWAQAWPEWDMSVFAVTGRIRLLVLLLDAALAHVGERYGIKLGELEILVSLRRRGEQCSATPTELAEEVWITAASITRRIDQLVKLKLVERERDVLDDRREVLVRLTQRGREVAMAVLDESMKAEGRLIQRLDSQARQGLIDSLRELLLSVEAPAGIPPMRLFRGIRSSGAMIAAKLDQSKG